ncbi:tryptophanase [Desulfitibacter alkalitolerans]|uniref:tryptophanase n=1 Tax=Desulfitibacter alkalitolerans TaxID=264641 RepID=UPI0004845B06|nr:tryptophanase [Desulfitibacter alkalitolerans]
MKERSLYAEPYKIKMVEPIKVTAREYRETRLAEAGYNVFNLASEDVYIDLLTDSGTSAMSDNQWSGIMSGDESYAGGKNYFNLKRTIKDVMGYDFVVPTHQGRGAENILMQMFVKEGDRIPGNLHFDTTDGHIRLRKALPVNLLKKEGYDSTCKAPFKGDIDLNKLEEELEMHKEKIPFVLITVTCNNNGGQPVSMNNLREARQLTDKYGVPLFLDVARFAENAFFIKDRDPNYKDVSIKNIVKEMFSYAHGCSMSAKKDALVNIGGFLAFKDNPDYYKRAVEIQIPFEGYATYGGLAGRDLEAMARGLKEVLSEEYLEDRIGQVKYLADKLLAIGIPIIEPPGGHGVYVDVKRFLNHLPQKFFPAQALVCQLYLEAGIRSVEIGACAFGYLDPDTGEEVYPEMELLRMAVPRRVYTDRHMDVVANAFANIADKKPDIKGLKLVYQAEVLRHFTAQFKPL